VIRHRCISGLGFITQGSDYSLSGPARAIRPCLQPPQKLAGVADDFIIIYVTEGAGYQRADKFPSRPLFFFFSPLSFRGAAAEQKPPSRQACLWTSLGAMGNRT